MNTHVSKRLFVVAAAVLAAVAIFATGFFVALGVRSVVAGPDSAPPAQVPVVSHTYDQIELPPGTWTGLDADTVDGKHSNEIHDADDRVTNASYATSAGSASTANSANTAGYATNAGSASTANSATTASYATQAGSAGTANTADTASYASDADTVDGWHGYQLQESLYCTWVDSVWVWVDIGVQCVDSPDLPSLDYVLVGGMCQYSSQGGAWKLMTQSYAPFGPAPGHWTCCYKDHVAYDTGWIKSTVIGCKTAP